MLNTDKESTKIKLHWIQVASITHPTIATADKRGKNLPLYEVLHDNLDNELVTQIGFDINCKLIMGLFCKDRTQTHCVD